MNYGTVVLITISSLHLLKFCEVSQTSSVTDLIPQLNYV